MHLASHFLLSLFFLNSYLSASEIKTVLAVSEYFENATNRDGSGFYWELIRKVYGQENIQLRYEIVPYQRAVMVTRNLAADFWVASYDREQDFAIYPKYAFDVDDVSALYRTDISPKKANINALVHKKVAWIRGYAYDKYIRMPMQKVLLNKRSSVLKMLQSQRIDFFLDDHTEMQNAFSEEELRGADLTHSPLLKLKLYLAFQNSERGRELAEIWDKNLLKLHQNGRLKTVYDKYRNYTSYYPF